MSSRFVSSRVTAKMLISRPLSGRGVWGLRLRRGRRSRQKIAQKRKKSKGTRTERDTGNFSGDGWQPFKGGEFFSRWFSVKPTQGNFFRVLQVPKGTRGIFLVMYNSGIRAGNFFPDGFRSNQHRGIFFGSCKYRKGHGEF